MTTTLVLLRHGQSEWNAANLFTGWIDVGLTEQGRAEARAGGDALAEEGFVFDVAHTSVQRRAITTLDIALDRLDQQWLPVRKSWRLNERHYGALQGLNKAETAERHGADQVHIWRRSYDVAPPPLDASDPTHPRHDRRYARLAPHVIPASECLADVVARMLPYWEDDIVADLRLGLTVLVSAHGNSLRALIKHLDGISDDDISELNLPTGVPILYRLDDELRPVEPRRYVGDAEAAQAAAEAVARQAG